MSESTREIIGILYAGDMGAAIASALENSGIDVVTTCAGRGQRTRDRCEAIGLRILPSIEDVVHRATIVISLVPPEAAFALAREVAAVLPAGGERVYVDANSISPDTARQVGSAIEARHASFVDASIHGLAKRLTQDATMYLSGAASDRVRAAIAAAMRVEILGKEPGVASMQKMLLGGLSKGIVNLFIEMSLVALEADQLDAFLESCTRHYPEVVSILERVLPTVPIHARRRGQEMAALENTIRAQGLRPGFASESRHLLDILGHSRLSEAVAPQTSDLRELIESIALQRPLNPPTVKPKADDD